MSLWDWSLRAWAADGVAIAALDLQDAQGQNIPLLFWAAWTARTGRDPDEAAIEAAHDTARAWEDAVTSPLRAVRRRLKARIPDMEDAAREAVREGVKALELGAERHLLAALEALSPPPSGEARPVLPVLIRAARAWAPVTPRTALGLLADRLPA